MIRNIATVRHVDTLIKKTTGIVGVTLNYVVKMGLRKYGAILLTEFIRPLKGYWEYDIELSSRGNRNVLKVSASQMGPCFLFSTH